MARFNAQKAKGKHSVGGGIGSLGLQDFQAKLAYKPFTWRGKRYNNISMVPPQLKGRLLSGKARGVVFH